MFLYWINEIIVPAAGCGGIYTCLGIAGSNAWTGVVWHTSDGLAELLLTDIWLVIVIPLVFWILMWGYYKIKQAYWEGKWQ